MRMAETEAALGLHSSTQLAVGQRVTALHPKERQLFTGTVLTPDGDHYKIQFDSRGIDFTSQRLGGGEGKAAAGWHEIRAGTSAVGMRASAEELALVEQVEAEGSREGEGSGFV
ncbi:MAG: hypothetical protein SGPRY_007879 [Prymnesium sp.]